jgi:hypothetical protein
MNTGRYTISIVDMSGNLLSEQLGVFSSDTDACTAARGLLRPGDRAIIMAGQKIVGRFSLAAIPHQAASIAVEPNPTPMHLVSCQGKREGLQIASRTRAWFRDWLWRPLAR